MTDVDTRPLNGQDFGQAELALRGVLDDPLAKSGSTFRQWVALNVIGNSATVMSEDDLVHRLVQILRGVDDGIAFSPSRVSSTRSSWRSSRGSKSRPPARGDSAASGQA